LSLASRLEPNEVVHGLAPADQPRLAVPDEHRRRPRHGVVVRAHCERVRAGGGNGEQVAAAWLRKPHVLDQDVAGLAVLPADAVAAGGLFTRAVGEERAVPGAVELRPWVVGHTAVDRDE